MRQIYATAESQTTMKLSLSENIEKNSAPHQSLTLMAPLQVGLRGMKNRMIECMHGRAWITFEGDYQDHIIARGQRLVIPNSGLVMIEALDD